MKFNAEPSTFFLFVLYVVCGGDPSACLWDNVAVTDCWPLWVVVVKHISGCSCFSYSVSMWAGKLSDVTQAVSTSSSPEKQNLYITIIKTISKK